MRTLHAPAAFALVAFAACLSSSVAETPPSSHDGLSVEIVDPTSDARAAEIQRSGILASNYLGQKLVTEVAAALKKGTPEDAVSMMHLQHLSADGQAVPGLPRIKAFKLTSLRLINVANSPDFAEQQALEDVEHTIRSGNKPTEVLVQHIVLPDGTEEWRAYRPLAVLPTCVTCHGAAAEKSPRLRSLLVQHAPATPATEFRLGEWRGLLRVTIEPAPKV